MAFTKQGDFTTLFASLADKPSKTAAEMKALFDLQPAELKATLNNALDLLMAVADGASGADNIGMTAITETGANATVQSIIEALITRLKATTDSASGADLIGATAITGLTGGTVQSLLEALKDAIDSIDPVPADGSITNAKLATDVKVGSLAALDTTEKSSVVGAVNELFQSASDGKSSIATAITGMGQTASSSETWAQLAGHIADISDDANAGVSDVLATKTFYQGGSKKTGTMTNNGITTVTPGTSDQSLSGFYASGSKVSGDADLVEGNIPIGINLFGVAGAYTGIKSVQYASINLAPYSTSGTATINSVVKDNTAVILLGFIASSTSVYATQSLCYFDLTNSTTLTLTRIGASNTSVTANALIIEFNSGVVKSKQTGSVLFDADSKAATISSVVTTKSLLFPLGSSVNGGTSAPNWANHAIQWVLTNSTTVTGNVLSHDGTYQMTGYFNIIELN